MNSMTSRFALAATVLSLSATPALAQDNSNPLTDIIVLGQQNTPDSQVITPNSAPVVVPDAANLVARLPGASINDNGPLSGQVQYHGVTGDRVLTRVNGQRFSSGGPNLMDPPLHYAPMVLIDHIELDRSIGPVRSGPSLGGSVNAVLKSAEFASGLQADLSAGYRSADNSTAMGAMLGYGTEHVRLALIASHERGDDMAFPGGEVASTGFERINLGASLGLRTAAGDITLEYRRNETDPSGNAPFPMDIVFVDTDFLRAQYQGNLAANIGLELSAGYVSVDHLMDNHSQRTPPASAMQFRANRAGADTLTAGFAVILGTADRHIRLGADYEESDRNSRITNPGNQAFFVEAIQDARTRRIGAYAEWRGALGPVESEIGLRYDHYRMRTGAPSVGPALPMMPRMLAMQFAAGMRDWSGDAVDIAARFWLNAGDFRPRLVLAHKNRAPGALERFGWLPTEASGGLADGNIYVGDTALNIEQAWIAEAGFDWNSAGAFIRPNIFYRRIDDFVQGVPFDATVGVIDSPVEMVANMNGDATPLRFANVDAEFYGADVDFGISIRGPLRLDGTASWVRGKRRDIDDNLYRIAPPNVRMALGWVSDGWNAALEGVAFADQDDVSRTNGEQATPGFVIANLLFGVSLPGGLRLDGGIENLFDREYAEHLSGYNRVMDSEVPLGARLPGAGRSGFVRLSFSL